jgi:hypothetical protein
MARHRLGWLWVTLAAAPVIFVACGGSNDTPGGGAGTTGTGGSPGTGGGLPDASVGSGGTVTPPADGAVVRVQCGDAGLCPANVNNPQNTRFCDIANNRCVECLRESDCTGDMGGDVHCNLAQGRCRPCVVGDPALGCPAGQMCVPGGNNNGACVITCTTNADCAAVMGNPFCNTTTSTCEECGSNADCVANMGNPFCDLATNNCEECGSDADCVANVGNPHCDLTTHSCETCLTDLDCAVTPATPFCRLQNQNCVQCRTVADCPPGFTTCPANGGGAGTCGGAVPDAAVPDAPTTDARPDVTTPVDAAGDGAGG